MGYDNKSYEDYSEWTKRQLENEVKEQDARIAELETQLKDAFNEGMFTAKGKLSVKDARIEELEATLLRWDRQFKALEKERDELRAQLARTERDANDQIEHLKTVATKRKFRIADLEDQLEAATTKGESLCVALGNAMMELQALKPKPVVKVFTQGYWTPYGELSVRFEDGKLVKAEIKQPDGSWK